MRFNTIFYKSAVAYLRFCAILYTDGACKMHLIYFNCTKTLTLAHGTDCHHRFVALILSLLLNDNWRHSYLSVLLTDTILLGAIIVLWHLRRPNLDVLAQHRIA